MLYHTNLGRTGFIDINKIKEVEHNSKNIGIKPVVGGLWCVRADHPDGWEYFARTSMPAEALSLEHAEITVRDDARTLIIDSRQALEYVFEKYLTDRPDLFGGQSFDGMAHRPQIDWSKVAQDYDVVEFRMADYPALYDELYGLDCDSAVILHSDVIEDIKNPPTITHPYQITELTIKEGVTEIFDEEYANYTSLTTVHLPSTLQSLSSDAFSYDAPLTQVIYNGYNLAAPELKNNDISMSTAFYIAQDMEPIQEFSQKDAYIICLADKASYEPDTQKTLKTAEQIIHNISQHDPDKWQDKTDILLRDIREYERTFIEEPPLTLIESISQLLTGEKTVQEVALSLHEQFGSNIQDNTKILENFLANDTHDQSLLTPVLQQLAVMQYRNALSINQESRADELINFFNTHDTFTAGTHYPMSQITLTLAINENHIQPQAISNIIHDNRPEERLKLEIITEKMHSMVNDIKQIHDRPPVDYERLNENINRLTRYLANNIDQNHHDIAITRAIAHDESMQTLCAIIDKCYEKAPQMDIFIEENQAPARLSKQMVEAGTHGLPHIQMDETYTRTYMSNHIENWHEINYERQREEAIENQMRQELGEIEQRTPENIQHAAQLTQHLVQVVNDKEAEITEEGTQTMAEPTAQEVYEALKDTLEAELKEGSRDCLDALFNECITQRNGPDGITFEMDPEKTSQILLASLNVYSDLNNVREIMQYFQEQYQTQEIEPKVEQAINIWMQPIYDITRHDSPSDDERDTRGIDYGDE